MPGVSDMFLPVAMGIYHGLFIELKDGKNKTTPEQEAFLAEMVFRGYKAVVSHGADEAIAAIKEYMGWDK